MSVGYINWYWMYTANNWGMYVNWIDISVLYMYCQQLGDICQLEVVCAPFGHRVGECTLCDIYTLVLDKYCQKLGDICQLDICVGIGYILPTIGGHMSVGGCL